MWPVAHSKTGTHTDRHTDTRNDNWGHPFRVSGFFLFKLGSWDLKKNLFGTLQSMPSPVLPVYQICTMGGQSWINITKTTTPFLSITLSKICQMWKTFYLWQRWTTYDSKIWQYLTKSDILKWQHRYVVCQDVVSRDSTVHVSDLVFKSVTSWHHSYNYGPKCRRGPI